MYGKTKVINHNATRSTGMSTRRDVVMRVAVYARVYCYSTAQAKRQSVQQRVGVR